MPAHRSIADLLRHEVEADSKPLLAVARATNTGQPTLWRFVHEGTDPGLALAERLMHHYGYVVVKADAAKGLNVHRPATDPPTRRKEQRLRNTVAKAKTTGRKTGK
jgi:hypothetical protein